MKRRWTSRIPPSVAVLLMLAAPAAAQEGEMASRLILELQQMREEVRELRGMVEAQAQEIENLERRQRDQYLDLDRRLSEGGSSRAGSSARLSAATPSTASETDTGTGSPEEAGSTMSTPVADPPPERLPEPSAADAPEVREPMTRAPDIATLNAPQDGATRELQPPSEAEREAYDQAFLALRETRYADAAEGFDAFLREHPDSTYAPNALYWLGEVYYVTRDFETALEQFERLTQLYPGSAKEADALLKIGFSHYELGQWARARAALEEVIERFPGTNYSRLAENRLRTMRLEGHL